MGVYLAIEIATGGAFGLITYGLGPSVIGIGWLCGMVEIWTGEWDDI